MASDNERQLGSKYRLIRVLGAGAMGEVWEGRNRDDNPVAVKLLLPHLAKSKGIVQRFVGERGVLTGIAHPNLVQVSDLVVEGDTLAIVMDLVDGPDLRSYLRKSGTLTPAQIVHLGGGVAAGLAAVHQHGVIHRDVKPENVLLQRGNPPTPKLADFGISFLADPDNANRSTAVVGTPYYMAPELIDGAAPSVQSDLYALGVMLYELACGVTPFGGGTTTQVLKDHAQRLPGRPDGFPDELWNVVNWLLRKDPGLRPTSAAQVVDALAGIQDEVAGVAALAPLTVPPVGTTLTGVGTTFLAGAGAGVSSPSASSFPPGGSGATILAGSSGGPWHSNPGASSAATSMGTMWAGGSTPGGSFPGGSFPGGSNPGGSYPGGSYPGVSYPGGPAAYPPGQVTYAPVVIQQQPPKKRTGLVVLLVGVLVVALAGLTYLLVSNRSQNTASPAPASGAPASTGPASGATSAAKPATTAAAPASTKTVVATSTVTQPAQVQQTQTVTTTTTTAPSQEDQAIARLTQQWQSDKAYIQSRNQWVVNLSSKQSGTSDPLQQTHSGTHVFFSQDIWDQYVDLKSKFSGQAPVYLLKKSDFSTKSDASQFWVIVATPSSVYDKSSAKAWCAMAYPQYSGTTLDDFCMDLQLKQV